MDCTSLVAVQWPTNAPIIGNMTFADCSSLLAIFLPAKLKEIKANAFTRCSNLTEIHYLGTEPQLGKLKVAARGNDSLLNADWYLSTIPTKQPKDVTTTVGKTVKFSTAASKATAAASAVNHRLDIKNPPPFWQVYAAGEGNMITV